jgi:ketosteroid isomerase-like protein
VSQENVEVVRRRIEFYNRRDLEALRTLHDPDVELDWSVSPGVQAGVYRGIDAVERVYTDGFDGWQEILVEPDCLMDAGESIVVPNISRLRGREGIEVSAQSTVVFTVRDRRLIRVCLYQKTEEALKAVGLEE